MAADDVLNLSLTDEERYVLRSGLTEWGGSSNCTEEMAIAMGFTSVDDLFRSGDVIVDAILAGSSLRAIDWCRALLATEVCFSSYLMGAAHDWTITTGLTDEETFALLRQIQLKMTAEVISVIGNGIGTRPHLAD